MLPSPSTSKRSTKPHLSSLLIKTRDTLGKAVNGAGDPRVDEKSPSSHSSHRQSSNASRISGFLPSVKTAAFVVSCLSWYLASALSSNTSKALLSSPKGVSPRPPAPFPYPVTLTLIQFIFIHLLSSAIASPTIMRYVPGYRRPVTRIVSNPGWKRIGDMAKLSVFNVVGHALSTVAISRVPVSTVHTIKALTPLFTVLSFRFLFNVHYSFMAYFSLVPLTLGVMMACTSLSFSANDLVGLSTALASTFIFVAQSIYSKNLVGRGTEEQKGGASAHLSRDSTKLDKINILYYTSACSTAIMIPMALYYDGPKLLYGPAHAYIDGAHPSAVSYVILLVTANGVVQFFQNFLAFSVLALVSPVTYSIASLFKRVFVICFAIIWFGQSVSLLQWLGIILTFIGLYIYNDAKSSKSIAKGEEKLALDERRKSMSLPTNTRNAVWSPRTDAQAPSTSAASTTSAKFTPATAIQTSHSLNQHDERSAYSPSHPTHHLRSASMQRSDTDTGIELFRSTVAPIRSDHGSPSVQAHSVAPRFVDTSAPRLSGRASQLRQTIEIGVPSVQDPRRSIPSPPPSRGPSSDDEGFLQAGK